MIPSEDKTKKMMVWSSEKTQLVGCWRYGQILVMKWRNHWSRLLVLAPFLAFTHQLEQRLLVDSAQKEVADKKRTSGRMISCLPHSRSCKNQAAYPAAYAGTMRRSWPAAGYLSRTAVSNQCLSAELSLLGYQSRLRFAYGQLISTWTFNLQDFTRSKPNFSGYPNKKTWNTQPFLDNCLGAPGKSSLQRLNQNMAVRQTPPAPPRPEKVGSFKKPRSEVKAMVIAEFRPQKRFVFP